MQEPKLKMSLQKYLTIGMPERLAVLCPGAESRAQGPAHRGGQGPEGLHGGFDCAHLLVEVGDGFRFHLGGRRWTEEKLDNCALFRYFFLSTCLGLEDRESSEVTQVDCWSHCDLFAF